MKCCEPKIIPIISPDGVVCFSFQRCGKCYACQCGKRGEMVVRMDKELKDPYIKSKYFITLTYSDPYLPVALSPEDWRSLSDYYHNLPIAFRRYDYSFLEPWRLSKFLKDIQDDFKVKYCHGRFDKHHNAITEERDVHIRYFATGEYGDISHR